MFFRPFQEWLGTKVKLSITFNLKMYGQEERTVQTLDDMLRDYIINCKENWHKHFPLVEFAYNNSFHSSIFMAPYESFYGRRCMSPIGWF